MKGDKVEIVIDAGGDIRTYEVAATRAGRRVEITNRRGVVEVSEVTRTGTAVRTARFMASRILAMVEYPADAGAARPEERTERDAGKPVAVGGAGGPVTAGGAGGPVAADPVHEH